MLSNNVAPLLIFNFSKMFGTDTTWASFANNKIKLGLPIPIPLAPTTLGIVDKGESNTFSIRTEVFNLPNDFDPKGLSEGEVDKLKKINQKNSTILQRGMNHEVEAKYQIRKGSLLAQILLPLIEKCFEFMTSDDFDYDVSYLNGGTLIFNGKISDFQTSPNSEDNDLLDVSFTITTNPSSLGFESIVGGDMGTVKVLPRGGSDIIPTS
jgi:hypothetical protein